jgi:hypothetical protein
VFPETLGDTFFLTSLLQYLRVNSDGVDTWVPVDHDELARLRSGGKLVLSFFVTSYFKATNSLHLFFKYYLNVTHNNVRIHKHLYNTFSIQNDLDSRPTHLFTQNATHTHWCCYNTTGDFLHFKQNFKFSDFNKETASSLKMIWIMIETCWRVNFRFSPCIIIVNHFYCPTNALNYTNLRG